MYQSGFREGLFKGQTIFVTGGAGGLGRCIAHELAFLGASLVLAGRTEEKLQTTRDEIEEDGGKVLAIYSGELRDEHTVTRIVSDIYEQHGQIHGLVNATGGQFPAKLRDLSLNAWNAVINNNLTSYFLIAREVYTRCMESKGGNIVNIGADYHRGMAGMGHNGAARAGLSNFTFTAAREWAHSGVRVNCVLPGFIATTGLDRYPESSWDDLKSVVNKAPIRRHGTSAELSSAVVFLMSDMASYITGTEMIVDGGIRLGSGGFLFKDGEKNVWESRVYNGFHRDQRSKILD